MKKILSAVLFILLLCSILIANTISVNAAAASGYSRTDWFLDVAKTIDGNWTSSGEWIDGEPTMIGGNLTFRSVWESPSDIYTNFIVEFFSDNTTDAGDYWEMCLDFDDGGGTALAADHYRIYIEGHSDLTVYRGGATGWTPLPSAEDELIWANSLSASPDSNTPHWILEINILKSAGTNMIDAIFGLRVAVYDANTTQLVSWPPGADRDIPDQWGTQTYESAVYPEFLTITAVVLLSSAAVAVSFYWLRKHPKTARNSTGKPGKIRYS